MKSTTLPKTATTLLLPEWSESPVGSGAGVGLGMPQQETDDGGVAAAGGQVQGGPALLVPLGWMAKQILCPEFPVNFNFLLAVF